MIQVDSKKMEKWNAHRRIEAAFNHEIPDRIPKLEMTIELKELNAALDGQRNSFILLTLTPKLLNLFHRAPYLFRLLKKLVNHPRLVYPVAAIAPRVISRVHRQFNYDMFFYLSGYYMIFNERIFRDFATTEKSRVVRNIRTGKTVWISSDTGAHARYGFMESPTDWDNYMEFDPGHGANYCLVEGAVQTCKKLDIVPLFSVHGAAGLEELASLFGYETLFKLMLTDRNFVRRATQELNDYAIAVAEGILQRGGKYVGIAADLGYTGRSFISPRMFQELFKPGMKKFCKRVHQLGGKVLFHSCGNVVKLMPDIVETGIDALHPIEKTAGNDIVEFKKLYGNKITLVGNVPIPLLTHGTPEETYDYVRFLLENISKDGGHIISSSHSVTQWCKLENFLAYHRAVDELGKYPIRS